MRAIQVSLRQTSQVRQRKTPDDWSSAAFCAKPCSALASLLLLSVSLPALVQRWHASTLSQLKPQTAPPLDDMAHMTWTRRDYAPNDIAALAQTKDGYLWIGSKLGLYRFDGRQFSPYPFTSADPRLPASDSGSGSRPNWWIVDWLPE